ncbi:GRIM-19 [Lipomyces starkeyi]
MVTSQDLPPKGGYDAIQWKRNLPSRGFRPSVYLGIMGAISVFGFWRLSIAMRMAREEKREKTWARIHILPALQAEADRDTVRRYYATLEREKAIMKDHPDWVDGKPVYHDGSLHSPTFVILEDTKSAR